MTAAIKQGFGRVDLLFHCCDPSLWQLPASTPDTPHRHPTTAEWCKKLTAHAAANSQWTLFAWQPHHSVHSLDSAACCRTIPIPTSAMAVPIEKELDATLRCRAWPFERLMSVQEQWLAISPLLLPLPRQIRACHKVFISTIYILRQRLTYRSVESPTFHPQSLPTTKP